MTLKTKCVNDPLIEEFISLDIYDIKQDGRIFTLMTRTGKISATGTWREMYYDQRWGERGYKTIRYKNKHLQLHRVIYRKFVGKLDATKEINHIDGNPGNNNYKNLELVTQGKNLEHSYRVLGRLNPRSKKARSLKK